MKSAFDILMERGFIEQLTHEEEIKLLLKDKKVSFYIGFDPTADSLTAGHFLAIMAMAHMQKAGHRPIALVGGGTTMVGDPTDKTDMRKMLTLEQINENAEKFKQQLSRFINFDNNQAILANNADWLLDINYIDFLREIGVHFSVNRMLSAECYKSRMEKGLTFLEFNYMLMQSYDFYILNKKYDCVLQLGGNDQWSNILGGAELIRRKEGKPAYGLTFKLLTTSEGKKMGKTEKGAIWLDKERTSPYEFFQYWRNIEDDKVEECLGLLTFLPMDEVKRLGSLEGSKINKAKEILAFEVTKIVHGEDEANKALLAARALFADGKNSKNIPTTNLDKELFVKSIDIITLLIETKLLKSRSEARRLIQQGGISINNVKVKSIDRLITLDDFDNDGNLIIKKGKKVYHQVSINNN